MAKTFSFFFMALSGVVSALYGLVLLCWIFFFGKQLSHEVSLSLIRKIMPDPTNSTACWIGGIGGLILTLTGLIVLGGLKSIQDHPKWRGGRDDFKVFPDTYRNHCNEAGTADSEPWPN